MCAERGPAMRTVTSRIRKNLAGIAALALLLIFAARPASASDTFETFGISAFNWTPGSLAPVPLNPSGAYSNYIIVDTTTGQVVVTQVTAGGSAGYPSFPLSFVSQQSGAGYTVLNFSGSFVDSGNVSHTFAFAMYLPVNSLVGYTGGSMCDGTISCGTPKNTSFQTLTPGGGAFLKSGNAVQINGTTPVPYLNPVIPSAAAPGGPAFSLSVSGVNFLSSATVNWNGSPRTTAFVDADHLTASILAADIAHAGTAVITVTNPGPGGGTSNPRFFQITTALTPTNFTVFSNREIDGNRVRQSNTLIGDFNGDGKLDLVAYANGFIYFLPGNGDGTFGTWTPSVGPAVPPSTAADQNTYLAAGDLNGDGKTDLVVMNANGTFVALGNGDGTFHLLSTSLSDVIAQGSVAIVDYNRDGVLDLAYIKSIAPTPSNPSGVPAAVQIQLGKGDGTFTPGIFETTGFSTANARVLATSEFAGAASPYFVVVGYGSGTFPVTGCPGDAGTYLVIESFTYEYALPGTTTCGTQAVSNASAVVGDFNGDGKADIAYFTIENGGSGPALLSASLGNGDGTFRASPFQVVNTIPAGFPATSFGPVLTGDFNGDGKLDLATGNQLFYGNGDGSFAPLSAPQNVGLKIVGTGDFNGDGEVDLLALGSDPSDPTQFDLRVLIQVPGPPDFAGVLNPTTQTTTPGGSASYSGSVVALNGFTGNVALSAGGLPVGVTASFSPATVTGGSGSYTLTLSVGSSVALGAYTITVTGTSGSLTHATTVDLLVNSSPGDFVGSVAASSDSYQNINAGQSATYIFQITPTGGFNGNVTLSVSGLPPGATGSFNPPTVTGGSGTSTLTVTTSASTPVNSYTLMITATSGALSHSGNVFLGVAAPGAGDFTGTITPDPLTGAVGQGGSYGVQIVYLNGFTMPAGTCLVLSVSGLPPGARFHDSCTYQDNSPFTTPSGIVIPAGEQHGLQIITPVGTATGTYTLLVSGSGGGRVRAKAVTLTITP